MAEEVSEKLRQEMNATFALKTVTDPQIAAFNKKLKAKTATQADVSDYSDRLGELLRDTLREVLTPEALPNETLYYNILRDTVDVMLKNAHRQVNQAAIEAQKAIDEAGGLGLNAIEAPYPQRRVNDLLYKAGAPGTPFDSAMKLLDQPVVTLTQAFYDDHIRYNADKRFRAGMAPKIIRTAAPKCCEWCSSLEGVYDYEDVKDTGNDVFRRHEFCRCTVSYKCDGERTEVWGRKHWEADRAALEKRKNYHAELKQFPTEEEVRQMEEKAIIKANARTIRERAAYHVSIGDTSPETIAARSTYGIKRERPEQGEQIIAYDEKKAAASILDTYKKGDIIDEGYDPADILMAITQKSTNFVIRDPQHPDSIYGDLCDSIPPLERFYDVKMHGAPDRVKIFYSSVDANALAKIILSRNDYNGGPVRLLSCETGKIQNGTCVGKELSELLGEDVLAPTEILIASSSGKIFIESETGDKGWMRLFHPDGNYEDDF